MAVEGGDGGPRHRFSLLLPSETCSVREEAPARQKPAAAYVGDAARQEDPAKRGVYPVRPPGWRRRGVCVCLTLAPSAVDLTIFMSV